MGGNARLCGRPVAVQAALRRSVGDDKLGLCGISAVTAAAALRTRPLCRSVRPACRGRRSKGFEARMRRCGANGFGSVQYRGQSLPAGLDILGPPQSRMPPAMKGTSAHHKASPEVAAVAGRPARRSAACPPAHQGGADSSRSAPMPAAYCIRSGSPCIRQLESISDAA